MLKQAIAEDWLQPKGVVGLFQAAAKGDDVEVYNKDGTVAATMHGLRQQAEKESEDAYLCWSDFVAPKSAGVTYVVDMCVGVYSGEV